MITCFFEDNKKALLRHVTVDGLAVKGDKILLVKRAPDALSHPGKYALPGGYLDRDEMTTRGVLRELKEETGYEGKIISLFRINSNPNRKGEDRQNVDFVYLIEPQERVSNPDHEVSEIKWFDLDNLPKEDEFAFDHFENIELYLQYKKNKISLPIINL